MQTPTEQNQVCFSYIYLMKNTHTLFILLLLSTSLFSQKKIHVLFIGDSYTSVNNLPLTVANVAKANGDTVIYDSSTPGGYTLQMQSTDTTTLHKIAEGGWDYVVIQAQSEEPSFPPSQVATQTFPYATYLDSLVHAADSCTETVFFLTWGHQNGDPLNCAGYPQICTYSGMQDRLTQSYLQMGQMNQALVAPVGEAWRTIFDQPHPYDLYETDSIHPSIYGTYLAANVFYEILFLKSALNDSFVTTGIPDSDAVAIRQVAYSTVFDSLSKWIGYGQVPIASFTQTVNGAQATFTSTGISGSIFTWNYGDGHTDTGTTSYHTYTTSGTYYVTLSVYDRCRTSAYSDSVMVTVPSGLADQRASFVKVYPTPASSALHIDLGGSDITGGYELYLANQLGQVCKRQTGSSSTSSLNVSDLEGGVYVLIIKTAASAYHYPISIVH